MIQVKTAPLFLLCCILIIPAISATHISFSDLTPITGQKVEIHNSSGGYVGTYNTSTTGIYLDPNESYFLVMIPENSNLLEHPEALLDNIFDYVKTNAVALIVLAVILVVVLGAALRR